ncbi:hypothetical protein [Natronorubrum texcoconense]|uniref:Uncharacterized protein n=1 Tax=Natronorubrum texcoconense TaxID=1095776 RepID=A0A1G8TRB9_9EURY|nr:hypothetical protein [Natronorubrum texcoconense]SDJ43954.1 hypothetical protein SAMN04515672_0567 [Natronorubrum texcoconense]
MSIPETLGLSSAALGAVFVAAWIVAIGVALYRYDRERITRRELSLAGGGALMWLAWSLLQVVTAFSGAVATAIDLLSLGLFVTGVFLLVHWWRSRDADERERL